MSIFLRFRTVSNSCYEFKDDEKICDDEDVVIISIDNTIPDIDDSDSDDDTDNTFNTEFDDDVVVVSLTDEKAVEDIPDLSDIEDD